MERKYALPPLKNLSDDQLKITSRVLLAKIHVITGWHFPTDPAYQEILKDQFTKKLIESYPTVNMEEIEYAFRSNANVKDWGKSLNLGLIDEVMAPYLQQRIIVSELEERMRPVPELPPTEIEESTNEELIEENKARWNMLKDYRLLSIKVFYLLGLHQSLTPDRKEQIRKKVDLQVKEWEFRDKDFFNGIDRKKTIDGYYKKYAIAEYFNNQRN